MSDLNKFRSSIREWLLSNCPESLRCRSQRGEDVWAGRLIEFYSDDAKLWFDRCVEKGYSAPDWPVKYGGAGLSADETRIFHEEMVALSCRPAMTSFALGIIGPALLELASEEQKDQLLK